MDFVILKTDIKTRRQAERMRPIFDLHPRIAEWHVDTEDIDNILRIKTSTSVTDEEIISLLKQFDLHGEVLAD